MKKQKGAILITILALLASCSSLPNNSEASKNKVDSDSKTTINNANDIFSNGNFKIISSRNGLTASAYAGIETGFYEIYFRPSGEGNIIFTDYSNKSRIFLSNEINATHTDATDTSYLPYTTGGCYPVSSGENLFIFKMPRPLFASTLGDGAKGYIYKSNLDGSNRTALYTFEDNEIISNDFIAFDGEAIYYSSYQVSPDGTALPTKINSVNISTGNKSVMAEFADTTKRYFLQGACKGSIVVKQITNPVNMNTFDGSEEDLKQAFNNQAYAIKLIAKDGSEKEIKAWNENELSAIIFEDKLVYYKNSDNSIYAINMFTGEETDVSKAFLNPDTNAPFDSVAILRDYYDNHIMISASNYIEENGEQQPDESRTFAIDMLNNNVSQITLKNEKGQPLTIHAEGNEYFAVSLALAEYPVTDYLKDGTPYTTNILVPKNVLITKQNYWNNIAEYINIEEHVYK